jgi:hypothetical protein
MLAGCSEDPARPEVQDQPDSLVVNASAAWAYVSFQFYGGLTWRLGGGQP